MLVSLRIQNLALVEALDWSPSGGFVALTGETGAGKSILIGALKLLLGERADKGTIRSGCESGSVEAIFQLVSTEELDQILEESGLSHCEEGMLVLRRVLSATGPSRQFVNGCACPLSMLKRLGESLVDLHGPHDHQSLFIREEQTRILDAYAHAQGLREDFAKQRQELLDIRRQREALAADDQAQRRESEMLSIQVREIEGADLEKGEEEALLGRFKAASNGQRLGELCGELMQRLSQADDNILQRLSEVMRLLRELTRLDSRMEPVVEEHASVMIQLEEILHRVEDCATSLESDPESLQKMRTRIDLIQSLKRKYGATLDEVISYGVSASQRLSQIENREEYLAVMEKRERDALEQMQIAAVKLSEARKRIAPKLEKEIKAQLVDLGFAQAGFEIRLEVLASPGPLGGELVEFLFAPNPGEPASPLRMIASSGENSRVMLALKTALAVEDQVPLLVFDEIDANVGGEITHRVAAKMREIGEMHQVICITHLPQVAAAASTHFVVNKVIKGGRTYSQLTHVTDVARSEEIARMLGGKTDSVLRHAEELLKKVPAIKKGTFKKKSLSD